MAKKNLPEQERTSRAQLAAKRKDAERAEQRRSRLRWGSMIAAVVVIIGGMVAVGIATKDTSTPTIQGLKTFDDVAAGQHTTEPVVYEQTPPVGGPHDATWLNCGIYSEPVPDRNAVHSLEHGAVWITYSPDLAADQVKALKKLVGSKTYMVLSPYADLPSPIVASAWGFQVSVDSADDSRLTEFIKQYRQGPQTPEPGAVCTGGLGTPTG